jgi:hypothetical protein
MASIGGMSFKQLEQDEEDDDDLDLTITGKYTNMLQQARQSPANLPSSAKSSSSSLASLTSKTAEASDLEEGADKPSSPHRKGLAGKTMLEYKEMLSGLKGKIQEKINKKIEDFSGGDSRDSSTSTTPDREHPTVAVSASGETRPNVTAANTHGDEIVVTKAAAAKLKAAPPLEVVKSSPAGLDCADGSSKPSGDGPPRPSSVPVKALTEDKHLPPVSLERHASSVPMKLSALAAEEDEDEDILVFEEHFKEEPFEDFTGGLTTSGTALRSRSKLKPMKEKAKTQATVSMSGRMKTPATEGEAGETGAVKKDSTPTDPYGPNDTKPSKTSSLMRLVSHDGQSMPWPKVVAVVAGLFAYFILPIPSYLSGLIAGCVLTSVCWVVYLWLTEPPRVRDPPVLIPIEKLPPMEVPEMKEPNVQEDGVYKVSIAFFHFCCCCFRFVLFVCLFVCLVISSPHHAMYICIVGPVSVVVSMLDQ